MYPKVEKPKENKSRAVANSVAQKQSNVKQGFVFVDNRCESGVQQKMRNVATIGRLNGCKSAIQLEKRGFGSSTPRFQETFVTKTGLMGVKLGGRKKILVKEIAWNSVAISQAAATIGEEWCQLYQEKNGKKHTPKTKGDYECSGPKWDQFDEGINVASDLKNPKERKQNESMGKETDEKPYEKTFVAYYEGEKDIIAIMQLEMRKEDKKFKGSHLYIRWLLGSPKRKGGGSTLVGLAKVEALREAEGELRVDSAHSAEEWYNKQGFLKTYDSTHVTDELEGEEDIKPVPCGCKFMKWTKESF